VKRINPKKVGVLGCMAERYKSLEEEKLLT
jgi:hypothetical protein